MKLKKSILLLFLSLAIVFNLRAQIKQAYKAEIEVQAIGTTNGVVPFWMRSNQFGSIPLSGISGSVLGRFSKDYDDKNLNNEIPGNSKLFNWGFGFEGRANGGKNSNVQLIEGYVKAKAWIFQLKGGRTRDIMGLNGDTVLSSGNFAISGNALGIPSLELSIPTYYRLPVLGGIFSIKGNFSHGWAGKVKILDSLRYGRPEVIYKLENTNPITYFHQKSFYARLGKEDWKLKLYGGFNHQVFWGNEEAAYGSTFDLTPVQTFVYVVTGKAYGKVGIPRSKIGNHGGSIDLGLEYNFDPFKILIYRQNFYDVGALSKLANIADGLNGVALENNLYSTNNNNWQWKKLLFEVFASKNQAGYPWSTPTASGDEDYYNNYYYRQGYTYKQIGLGNPLITRRQDARQGQAIQNSDFFINNRVLAFHLGLEGSYKKWQLRSKATFSNNFGTFGTSIYGNSTGSNHNTNPTNIFVPVKQFSLLLEGLKSFENNFKIGISTSIDRGRLLNNSFGTNIRVIKLL